MKRLFTVFALLFPLVLPAQDKIEGIGKFKVGVTKIGVVESLAKELNLQVTKDSDTVDEIIKGKPDLRISKLMPDSSKSKAHLVKSVYCPETDVYFLSKYTISGFELTNIYLTFHKGVLIEFNSKVPFEIKEALDTKYGEGEGRVRETIEQCTHRATGIEIPVKKSMLFYSWKNNDILASFSSHANYDRDCKKYYINLFSISQHSVIKEIMQCDRTAREVVEKNVIEAKKKKLKDF